MTRTQFFSHRPPTSGIHLLTDPFPERLNGQTSLFTRAETLSSQREFIASSGRLRMSAEETAVKKK
jgi:hypothetical protein